MVAENGESSARDTRRSQEAGLDDADNTSPRKQLLQTFECGVCADDKSIYERILVGGTDGVCHDCFYTEDLYENGVPKGMLAKFRAALKHEEGWKLCRWGNEQLKARDFIDRLDEEIVRGYEYREHEYRANENDRIYCPHNIISGSAPPLHEPLTPGDVLALSPQDYNKVISDRSRSIEQCKAFVGTYQDEATEGGIACNRCFGRVCDKRGCNGAIFPGDGPHDCDLEKKRRDFEEERRKAFDGLTEGQDYRFCSKPHCGGAYTRDEGCNFIQCSVCKTGLCWLCGEIVEHHSDHWSNKKGKGCPKFGRPEDTNAVYDPPTPKKWALLELDSVSLRESYLEYAETWGQRTPPIITHIPENWNIYVKYSIDTDIEATESFPYAAIVRVIPTEKSSNSWPDYSSLLHTDRYFKNWTTRLSIVIAEYERIHGVRHVARVPENTPENTARWKEGEQTWMREKTLPYAYIHFYTCFHFIRTVYHGSGKQLPDSTRWLPPLAKVECQKRRAGEGGTQDVEWTFNRFVLPFGSPGGYEDSLAAFEQFLLQEEMVQKWQPAEKHRKRLPGDLSQFQYIEIPVGTFKEDFRYLQRLHLRKAHEMRNAKAGHDPFGIKGVEREYNLAVLSLRAKWPAWIDELKDGLLVMEYVQDGFAIASFENARIAGLVVDPPLLEEKKQQYRALVLFFGAYIRKPLVKQTLDLMLGKTANWNVVDDPAESAEFVSARSFSDAARSVTERVDQMVERIEANRSECSKFQRQLKAVKAGEEAREAEAAAQYRAAMEEHIRLLGSQEDLVTKFIGL